MDMKDRIGKRGENIFTVLISKWCEGRPWFDETRLGEKFQTMDFLVQLVNPSAGRPQFYVQIKSTSQGYVGQGSSRRLKVKVSAADVAEMKAHDLPTYIVGIDIHAERGFILSVDHLTSGLNGLPTIHPLDCWTMKRLWKEVDTLFAARKKSPGSSRFR